MFYFNLITFTNSFSCRVALSFYRMGITTRFYEAFMTLIDESEVQALGNFKALQLALINCCYALHNNYVGSWVIVMVLFKAGWKMEKIAIGEKKILSLKKCCFVCKISGYFQYGSISRLLLLQWVGMAKKYFINQMSYLGALDRNS